MRLSWFSSLSSVSASAALALLFATANASAQSRDDSNRNDSDSSSDSSDNDRSGSRDSGDRSDQSGRSSSQSSRGGQSSRSGQAGRQTGHAMLGVTFYNDQSSPLEVRRVTPGSPAEEAGLERGDEILSVDGRRVSNVQQLRQQIDRLGTNEEVELGILRDGRRSTVTARLTANQPSGRNQQYGQQAGGNQQYGQQAGGNQQYGQQAGGNQQYGQRSTRNRQSWNEEQYGYDQGQNNQGQWSSSPEFEQGYWAGYQRAQQEFGHQSSGSQRGGSQGYASQASGNERYAQGYGNRSQGNSGRGYQSQGYGNQGYGNQGYGNQSYLRGSRGAGNWQEEGSRGGNHGFLGVVLDENDRNAARVSNVYPNSPAEEAGIRPGDEIVSIDDEDVKSSRDVRRLLSQKDSNDDVTIEVERGGRQRTLHATLTSQQEFLSSQNEGSYRMGRRTNYDEQAGDNRARSRQNRSSDEDQENDNY